MSPRTISLRSRVRYEGLAKIVDRRPTKGADLEKLPEPIWYTVGHVLRYKFGKPLLASKRAKPASR
jgi:hypothetical protein